MKRLAYVILLFAGCGEGTIPRPEDSADAALRNQDGGREDTKPDSKHDSYQEPPLSSLPAGEVLAYRLAQFIWGRDPDTSVSNLAAAAKTQEDVEALAKTMLLDKRARNGASEFFRTWLNLDRLAELPKKDPTATRELRESLYAEAVALGTHVVFDDGLFETLLTTPYTFMDSALARHYGAPAPAEEGAKTSYPTPERIGLFGSAGVLARFSGDTDPPWPPRWYGMISQALLCESRELFIGAPTALDMSDVNPAKPIRAQIIERTERDGCRLCHQQGPINRIGFAFMRFDILGRYRPEDVGGPIDTSASIELSDGSLTYKNQPELMRQLATMPVVRACFARRYFEHALPEQKISSSDPSLRAVQSAFEASGGSIQKLITAIARSGRFLKP